MRKIIVITTTFLILTQPFHIASYGESRTEEEAAPSESIEMVIEETSMKMLSVSAASMGDIESGSVGGGSLLSPLLSESFRTDLATGSATINIPIIVPPGRKNMQPNVALSYSSSNANGVCGVGWGLTTSSIQRSTKRGIPKYDNSDTFVFTAGGSTGELVLIDPANNEYRQNIEGAFMRYVFDNANSKWTIWDKNGTKYTFGSSESSRITDASGTLVFAWFLDRVEDVYGNAATFTYEKNASQIYSSKIEYTSNDKVTPPLSKDKAVEFTYEDGRPDILHNYRSGWKIETNRRLKEIHVKVDDTLAWRYSLKYEESPNTNRSLLAEITVFDDMGNSLSPKKFKYQTTE